MRKVQIFLTLVVLSIFCSTILTPPIQFQHPSIGAPHPIASIPAHSSVKNENSSNSPENVNFYLTSEPAPMGIADYGLGSNGAYRYNTTAFLGTAQISSLVTSAPTSSGGPNMTLQLNVVLPFSSKGGSQFVYWLQNVLVYDTSNNQAYFENNVWNMSSSTAEMTSSGISGSGQVYSYKNNQSFYAESTSSYSYIPLPDTVQFLINSTINSQNEPKVYFEYNYGTGWQTYDVVTFPVSSSQSLDAGMVVDGTQYNPYGTYYDSELILGGAGSGWNTNLVKSNIQLQLQFWNGHNYQQITNAHTFGSNTLEGISNALSSAEHYSDNGTLYAQVSPGSGTLSTLYTQSQLGIVTIQSSISSGMLYIESSSASSIGSGYSFTGQSATLTLFPGTYTFYVYSEGRTQFGRSTETALAGQTNSYFITPESTVLLNLSYSVLGGGNAYYSPTLSYTSNGLQKTSTITTTPSIYYVDKGSTWSVTSTLGGSSQERWTTDQATSNSATSSATLDFTYYHQYLVEFNFSVTGGGSGYSAPEVTLAQFGSNASSTAEQMVWADSGSHYTYTSLLSGSTQSERWKANNFISGQVLSNTIKSPLYYHQFAITAGFSLSKGSSSPAGPVLTSRSFGLSSSSSLTTAPAIIWVDAGSPYSLSNNVTISSRERLVTNASNSGIATASLTLMPVFIHQYYVTIQSDVQSGGTVSPSSGWIDAGNSMTISSSAAPGWKFEMWNGSGSGSYNGTANTTTLTVQSPIVESGIFYPGLTIMVKGSGSVSYSFGSLVSTVATTETVYVPVGTTVTLNAVPSSFFDKMDSWSGGVIGANSRTTITVQSPATVQAQFSLNLIVIGAIAVVILVLVAAVVALARKKKNAPSSPAIIPSFP